MPPLISRAQAIGLTVAVAAAVGFMLWAFQSGEPEKAESATPQVAPASQESVDEARPESSVAPTLNGLKLSDSLDQKQ
jgi:hypothetical protein